jgi:predicted dehydrogenase
MVNDHGVGGRTQGMKYYQARTREDRPHGMAFYGTNGTLYADRIGFEIYPEPRGESGPGATGAAAGASEGYRMERKQVAGSDATARHVRNFIDCVRSRKNPVADVETGFHSTAVPLLGNIAIRSGHKLKWDSSRAEIVNDRAASAYLARRARKPWYLI